MAWFRKLFEPKARPPTQASTGPSQNTDQAAAAQRRQGTASPQGSSSPTRTTSPKSSPRSSPSRKARSPPPRSPSRLAPPATTLVEGAPPSGGESSAKVHPAPDVEGIPPPPLSPTTRDAPLLGVESSEKVHSVPEPPSPSRPSSRPPTPPRSSPSRKPHSPPLSPPQSPVLVPDSEVKANQAALQETISKTKELIQPPDTTIPPSIVSGTDTMESDGLSEASSHRAAPEILSEKLTAALTESQQETAPPPPNSGVVKDNEILPETGENGRNHSAAKHEMTEEQTAKKQPEATEQQKEVEHTEKASNSDGPETREVVNDEQQDKKQKQKQQVFIQKKDKKEMQSSMEDVLGAVKVITLAGDNKGASMQLGFDPSSKERPIHIHRAYKSNHNDHRIVDNEVIITTDIEEAGRKSNSQETNQEQEVLAVYANSNVQGVNNAILVDCTITERNPGVSLQIPSCLQTEPVNSNDETAPIQAHKAVQLKKFTHEPQPTPTLRRRCLRGLLLESDSETENPSKRPRRHGCRVGCKDK
ncbi:unnamed protein product [Cuscuta epithymum]|uniref:Uncharacterized protein n=1 Tax=Cuscuta epithymum TaxID=186058 RepID=A0AAV0G1H9_9ASTE|nr:unnamed protein product [Cuscuta epithymum]